MDETLRAKIREATVRRAIQVGLRAAVWTTTAAFGAACLAVTIDKVRPMGIDPLRASVLAGAAGLLVAIAYAIWRRPGRIQAACDFDRRFDLKERVSTLISLDEEALSRPAGQALARDVAAKTAELRVAQRYPFARPRHAWLPLVPLAATFLVGAFMGPLAGVGPEPARASTEKERERIAAESTLLEKKIAERKKDLAALAGDKDLERFAEKIEEAARDLKADPNVRAEDAVLKLSDLAKKVDEERRQLDSLDLMKRSLQKLAQATEGPGQKLAQALKQGDFKEASKQLDQLSKQIQDKKLGESERKKLAEQLSDLKRQLEKAAALSDKAEQLKKSLPPDALKDELAKLAKDAEKLDQLQALAEQLQRASKCAHGEGGPADKELQEALVQASKITEELARDELKQAMLEAMLDDLQECRGGMCAGKLPGIADNARGKGQGAGPREEKDDATRSRLSRSKSQQNQGPISIVGPASGKQFRGESLIEIREQAAQAGRAAEEAITRQRVPRDYQDHAREYFDRLNGSLQE